ncbi:MAG TPA: PD-(D/E)XK nuclease family protein [Bacteroidales bacterium]|nr:PD-(D/E)XK nuclease family protein [Bacteroidales bacterium]
MTIPIQTERIKQVEQVLSATNQILKHQKEREILLGENFNIFSILKMERKENSTHSAFLCELFKPDGVHLKGSVFLSLFLKTIGYDSLDINSAHVKAEYYIGKVDNVKKTGGRIDIFIWDKYGKSISIENKIGAGDVDGQIERYCNYHKDDNTVYYLTLDGKEPSPKSKGDLIVGENFFIISYRSEIIEWLDLCMKESADNPILRETIKQYMILSKKNTNTMENKEQKELQELILNNFQVSSYIVSNLEKAVQDFRVEIRREVIRILKERLSDKYVVEKGSKISETYAQIWIKPIQIENSELYFGIESFSGRGNFNGHLFIGVFNSKASKVNKNKYADESGNIPYSNWWINIEKLNDYDGITMNLGDHNTIIALTSSKEKLDGFINEIVNQVEIYLDAQSNRLIDFIIRS